MEECLKEFRKLKQDENENEISGNKKEKEYILREKSIKAMIILCEAKEQEIINKEGCIDKAKEEKRKMEKENKECKEKIAKYEKQFKQLETDNEQLIKEKCQITKQNHILEENNSTLRTIIKHFELNDMTEKTENERKTENEKNKKNRDQNQNKTMVDKKEDEKKDDEHNKTIYEKNKETIKGMQNKRNKHKEEYCWYHDNRRCKYGNKCWNTHRKNKKENDENITDWKNEYEREREKNEKVGRKTTTENPKENYYCWYNENETCNFGEKCWYHHRNKKKQTNNMKETQNQYKSYKPNNNKAKISNDQKETKSHFLSQKVTQEKKEEKNTQNLMLPLL